jgi:hypothetical protein
LAALLFFLIRKKEAKKERNGAVTCLFKRMFSVYVCYAGPGCSHIFALPLKRLLMEETKKYEYYPLPRWWPALKWIRIAEEIEHLHKYNKPKSENSFMYTTEITYEIGHPLPDYLVCENNSELYGAEIMLYTKPPFWTAQIYKFTDSNSLGQFLTKHNLTDNARQMSHYNIACVGKARLVNDGSQHRVVPQEILQEMLHAYYVERVSNKPDVEQLYKNYP